MTVAQWSTTAALNVLSSGTVGTGGVNINEGMFPANVNDAMRDIMKQIADYRVAGTFGSILPTANDSGALGSATLSWSDLFLAATGVINWNNGDVLATHSTNTLTFTGASSGYVFDAALKLTSNDGAALGASGVGWADLFLASGGVLNWNAGNYTITHTAGLLTTNGGLTLGGLLTLTTGAVTSGTWTPTITGVLNLQASTPSAGFYMRVGDMVTCWVNVNIDPTAASQTTFRISLPVASDFAATECIGVMSDGASNQGKVGADTVNNEASATFTATGTAATNFAIHFSYKII